MYENDELPPPGLVLLMVTIGIALVLIAGIIE